MKVRNYTVSVSRCPRCGNLERKRIYVFDGQDGSARIIRCSSCKKQICIIEKTKKDRYNIDLSCALCGEKHKMDIPVSEFWHTSEKKFVCSLSGMTTLALGDAENVERIVAENFLDDEGQMSNGDEEDDLFEKLSQDEGAFSDSEEFYDCLEHFKHLSDENRINCDCGANLIQLQVEEDGFRIICSGCGREEFMEFTTRDGIEYIKSLSEIYLS